MHNRKSIVIFAALAAITAIAAAACGSRADSAVNNANSEPAVVDITAAQAVVREIPSYFEATGNLASDTQTDVAPAIAGKIAEVNFDIGTFVKTGDVLVRLDSRDARIRLEQARAQLDQQRNAVIQADANVDQAIANLRQVQARLGIGDGESFKIENFSQVKSVSAQLVLAEKELSRTEKLLETGDASKSTYDQRRAQRDQLLGQLDEARANAAIAIRAVTTAQAAVASAKAAAASARSGVGTAEAAVAQAEKGLSDTDVRSPIDGFVAERTADVGEYISPNTPNSKIATIVKTSTLRVKIDIAEQSVGEISRGQFITLQVSAYPDRGFPGRIVRISPSINTTARTLMAEAEVENPDGLLKPGQFATVRITQLQPVTAVMIPAEAVRSEGEVNRVFVVKDGAVREQIVQLGLLEDGLIQIKQGLAEGDTVATSNLNLLSDGVFVRR